MGGDSLDKLKTLQISSLEEEDEGGVKEIDGDSDDDDEDSDDEEQAPLTLGFVEKPQNSWSLLGQLFPAWLDPINLPLGRCCTCDFCGEPSHFLPQWFVVCGTNLSNGNNNLRNQHEGFALEIRS